MTAMDGGMHSLGIILQVFLLDILLSGDNAIVIALACRKLPLPQRRKAIALGTGAAILLRVFFTSMAALSFNIPSVKLLGMIALIVIAIKLLLDEEDNAGSLGEDQQDARHATPDSLWSIVGVIIVADVTMSLDNVVALAAVSQGDTFFLLLGLGLSVPLLMYGSLLVTSLLDRYPILVPASGAMLGWVAGQIGMSDSLIAPWIAAQAPGLTLAMPIACAVFVFAESRIIRQNKQRFPAPQRRRAMAALQPADAARSYLPLSSAPSMASSPHPAELPSNATPVAAESTVTREPLAPVGERDTSSAPRTNRPGVFAIFMTRQGSLFLLVAMLALPLLWVIGSIVYDGVINKGILPAPHQLARYECPGFNGPFWFYYQHGKENVQIRSSTGKLDGAIHYRKIDWYNFSGDASILGFLPPEEVEDDVKQNTIRINGGSFSQIDCANADRNVAHR